MGLFSRRSRRRDDEPEPEGAEPDESLAALTRSEAARFTAAAQRAFSSAGLEAVPRGDGSLQASDGLVLNLHNLAHAAAQIPERQWGQLLDDHVRALMIAHSTQSPSCLEEVRDRLYLRLFEQDVLAPDADARPVVGDLVAVASVDHPEHVQSLTAGRDVEALGGWAAIEPVGLANLRAETADEVFTLDDDIHVSIGGFFNASRLLVLDTLLAQDFRLERPSHGVVVAVPNRHVVAAHPLTGPSCVAAIQTMIAMAQSESDKPGGLSPDLFFWRDGRLEQVTHQDDGGRTTVAATGMLGTAMAELGLLSGE